MAEQSVTIWKNRVVDMQILQDLNHCQRRAWQDRLPKLMLVKEAYVLIHVEDVLMRQAFNILGQ